MKKLTTKVKKQVKRSPDEASPHPGRCTHTLEYGWKLPDEMKPHPGYVNQYWEVLWLWRN